MIVFRKDLKSNPHWAYNNNIIQYRDNSGITPLWSDVFCDDFEVRIFPDPNGYFTFNFKEYVKALINTKKFADTVVLNVTSNANSLVRNDTNGMYINLPISIEISRANQTSIITEKEYSFLAGIEFLERFKKEEVLPKGLSILMPVKSNSSDRHRLNYWPGYPFDFSLYAEDPLSLVIKNRTNNNVLLTLICNNKVNRITFCDGRNDETIEDHLPISFGHNLLEVYRSSFLVPKKPVKSFIDLVKHNPRCGIYVKFRNQYGGWTYWLFHQNDGRSRSVSDLEEINNDFNNLEDTISPTIQAGKSSTFDTLKAFAVGLDIEDVRQLEYIVDSPKVYLYTGQRFSKSINDVFSKTIERNIQWLEIKCSTKKLDVKKLKKVKNTFELDFALPQRERVTLL